MSAQFVIDTMTLQDWPQVRAIFGEGLATGLAAFRKTPPIWTKWDAGHLPFGRVVARSALRDPAEGRSDAQSKDARVLGWGALAPVADS